MQTNLFTTRPLTAHRLSAAVGSGKTRAAIAYMARPDTAQRNFLYVAPTIRLLKQTEENLRAALAQAGGVRNVHLIHQQNATEQEEGIGALAQARQTINAISTDAGEVVFLTTNAFIESLAFIERPQLWDVILDEAFDPASFGQFELGEDLQSNWSFLMELFEVKTEDGARLIPREGRSKDVADVARNQFSRVGARYKGLRDLSVASANPALRCELVLNDRVRAILAGEPLPEKRKRGESEDDDESEFNVLEFASYLDPRYLSGFREVLFLSALFEETILYLLWTRALGVEFKDHPEFPRELLRDTHREQGWTLAVGHLLHEQDTASKRNLYRDASTGTPKAPAGSRVLDRLVSTAAGFIAERYGAQTRFLLQTNVGTEYGPGQPLLPATADPIPAKAHGLDAYKDRHHVVALCVTNPKPQHLAWLAQRTGLKKADITRAYRIHSVYQGLGRCSIRSRDDVARCQPKTLLTAGKEDAAFIRDLFPGSLWLGQVGAMPAIGGRASTAARAPSKTSEEADRIGAYLASVGEDTTAISSRRLRAELGSPLSGSSWTRAVFMACSAGSGWRLRGGMVERVTWSKLTEGARKSPSELQL